MDAGDYLCAQSREGLAGSRLGSQKLTNPGEPGQVGLPPASVPLEFVRRSGYPQASGHILEMTWSCGLGFGGTKYPMPAYDDAVGSW